MVGHKANHKLDYNLNVSYSRTFAKDFTFVPAFIQSTTNYLSKSNENLSQGYRNYSDALVENTINYDGKFDLSHQCCCGSNIRTRTLPYTHRQRREHARTYYLQVNNAEETDATSYESEHVLASYIGRINYDFNEKYLIRATARRDGSSRLSSNDRWDWFLSVSGGWRMEREEFFP